MAARRYLPEWEREYPWLAKFQGGMLIGRVTEGAVSPGDSHEDGGEEHAKLYEERAYCMWCSTDMDCHSSRFSAHAASHVHQRNQELVERGDWQQAEQTPKKFEGNLDEMDPNFQKRGRGRPKKYPDPNEGGMVPTPTIFDMLGEPTTAEGANNAAAATNNEMPPPGPPQTSFLIRQENHDEMQQQQPDGTQQTVTTEQVTINVEAVQEQQQVQVNIQQHQHIVNGEDGQQHIIVSQIPIVPAPEQEEAEQVVSAEDMKMSGIDVKVLAEGGETLPLERFHELKTEVPMGGEFPMCTLKANAQHPSWYKQILAYSLTTGVGYDCVWQCNGGLFRVHKFVLAAFSSELKKILPENEEDARIFTPDLTKDMVKAMLCIMYTGTAKIQWKALQEINNGFKLIGFCGKDLTANPYQNADSSNDITIAYSAAKSKLAAQDFTQIKISDDVMPLFDGKPDPDLVAAENIKTEPKKVIKIENEENQPRDEWNMMESLYYDNSWYEEEEENIEPYRPKKRKFQDYPIKRGRGRPRKNRDPLDDFVVYDEEELERERRKKRIKRERMVGDTRHRETRTTYPVVGRGAGELSRKLVNDLFDDPAEAKKVKVITVCPICFKLFDDRENMREHKLTLHQTDVKGMPTQNSMIIGKNTYQCRKCEKTLELKHLVWFVKHYKFCGFDDTKANEILGVDDEEEGRMLMDGDDKKKNGRDQDVMYVDDNRPNLKKMSRALLGKECPEIWGCRKCYTAYENEDAFMDHINSAHDGKIEHGTCYDHESQIYSCKNCKVFKTNKSIHYFIYHLSNCNVDAQAVGGIVPIDDEEDIDEDTYYEFVDPWGIVNRPLKIRSARSKWICESLFGMLYSMLFPCHLCYQVFKSEDEIREHFRITHPGVQNFMEHGDHYNKLDGSFNCPVCKRDVCKKQRNSIYFTYHMRKCDNKVFTVHRTCDVCQKTFSSFRTYQYHIQTKCGTSDSICHICGMVLKTNASLQKHVMVSHSDARPYPCKVCNKAFKRAPDLDHHMKLHMGSLDWSCDKCGKAFPVKKALKHHMKTHMSESEKPHVCHICGNRFMRKAFLTNHLTTHSAFRAFACEVCNAQVKTRDSLKQHRKKVHRLFTPIPESCILKPEGRELDLLMPKTNKLNRPMGGLLPNNNRKRHNLPSTLVQAQIKEEVLPILGEELELPHLAAYRTTQLATQQLN